MEALLSGLCTRDVEERKNFVIEVAISAQKLLERFARLTLQLDVWFLLLLDESHALIEQ